MRCQATLLFCVFFPFLSHALQLNCSWEPRCRCFYDGGILGADCSSLNLTQSPKFQENVRYIYLNNNVLTEIPTDMSKELLQLDLSKNNITNPKKAVLSRYKHLQWLNVAFNCLWSKCTIWPSRFFDNLTKLNTLLMNSGCIDNSMKYSNECFYGLSSLRHIELNGLGEHNFEDAFEVNNSIQIIVLKTVVHYGRYVLNIIQSDTFKVFQQLKNLTLFNCGITSIEKGTFAHMNELVYLDISHNQGLTLSILPNITHDLQYTKIQTLIANNLNCRDGLSLLLKIEHIEYLRNTSLKELYLADNRIGIIENRLIKYLPKSLTYININDNPLICGFYVLESDFLSNLETLHIEETKTVTIFDVNCNYNSNSCENKEGGSIVNVTMNMMSILLYYQIPPKLKHFSIANRKINFPLLDNSGIRSNNSLTHLYVQGNLLYDIQYFSGLWRLEYLDLSNNFCFNISKQSFHGMTELLFLNLSRNLLGKELQRQSTEHVFDHLYGLQTLDLSHNWISLIDKDMFVSTSNLQRLYLSNNEIERVTFDLTSAPNLQILDLSFNKIMMLDSKSMSFLDTPGMQLSILMSNNPLQCTCQSMKFLKWMRASSNKNFTDRENCACIFMDEKKIELRRLDEIINTLKLECTSFTTTIIIVTIILLVTLILVSFAIMYRYRWKLRYLYYAGKRSYRGYSRISNLGREYQFDAFISYAESERAEFIPNLLKLEKENNLKFCIHIRDFIIGVNIAENITNAIHNSKRTVCFLSKAFLESEFCKYEAQMARMESIYRGGETTLFVVLVDKDLGSLLPQFLKDVIKEQTYLEYDQNISEEFWNAMTQALKEM